MTFMILANLKFFFLGVCVWGGGANKGEMICGGRKTVPQQALFNKKIKYNQKVSFDVISNDTF
jgi:hypothetical protein